MDIVKSTERRIAVALQGRRPQAEERDPTGERGPRKYLFDDLFVQRYDESSLDTGGATPLWDAVPSWVRLAREVQRRRDDYDAIVTWSERVTLSLMTLQSLQRTRKPHIAMMYWFSRPSVRLPMLAFARSLHAIVTWSSAQRRYAIERLAIPAEKIYLIKHFVDPLFFSPRERMLDTICSAGAEMRDYPTLLKALRGTDLPCHLATDHVWVDTMGFARRIGTDRFASLAGDNVTIGKKTLVDLRELYARSRFGVVPLQESDTDNGVSVILEAMAMGKPVICSRTRGQVDVIEEGVTGLFVPVGDEKALRAAMLELWHDPARARDGASRARLRRKEPQPGQVLPRRQRRDRSLARGLPGKGRGLRHALRNGRLTVPPAIRGSTRPATSPIGGKRATFSGPAGVPVVTGPLDRQRAPGPARRRARRKITLRPKRREPSAGSQVWTPRRRRPWEVPHGDRQVVAPPHARRNMRRRSTLLGTQGMLDGLLTFCQRTAA